MKKTKEGSQSAYSYLYNIYNYSDSLDFTSIPIQALIDRLVIFSRTNYIDYLYEQLSTLYEITDEGTFPTGTYKRFAKFKKGNDVLLLLYKPRYYKGRPYFSLTLHEPHGHMMEQVHSIFQKLDIFPKVSTIECTWDFYKDNPYELLEYLKNALFLKYQRSASMQLSGTFYTNNLRKSSRGIRLYIKQVNGKTVVRLELELHRTAIRNQKSEINFPVHPDMLEHLDFTKFFDFRSFREEELFNYLYKKSLPSIARARRKKKSPGSHPLRGKTKEFLACQIKSWISCLGYYTDHDRSLMKIKEELKCVPNSHRFFEKQDGLSHLLSNVARQQGFCL